MVIKQDGKVTGSMIHTVSADGKTQTIKGTDMRPDGSTSDFDANFKRVGSGSGWAGTWESTDMKTSSPDVWEISAYEGDGLTFYTPAYKDTLSMKFDGKDYEDKGATATPGATSSGKRVNAHTLDVTGKVKSEVMDHTKYEVSKDGKTLTLTIHETGQPNAMIIVYAAALWAARPLTGNQRPPPSGTPPVMSSLPRPLVRRSVRLPSSFRRWRQAQRTG